MNNFKEAQEKKIKLRVSDAPVQTSMPQIEHLQLEEQLSSGRRGALYKSVNVQTGAHLAVKVLSLPAGGGGAFKKRLNLEIESLSRLAHSSILPIVQSGETADGLPYLATEFVEDPSLADLLHSKSNLAPSIILDYLTSVCGALAHAHENGVVHRHLSAENIFVSEVAGPEQVRVCGFGFGWIGDQDKAQPQNDVYAFGKIMQDAFSGCATRSPSVDALISHCVAETSSQRYSDCGEVLRNLLLVAQDNMPSAPTTFRATRAKLPWFTPFVFAAILVVAVLFMGIVKNLTSVMTLPTTPSKSAPAAAAAGHGQSAPASVVGVEGNGASTDRSAQFAHPSSQPASTSSVGATEGSRSPSSLRGTVETATTDRPILTKEAVKRAAVVAGVETATAYHSLTPEQKTKVKKNIVTAGTKTVNGWKKLDTSEKEAVKKSASDLFGKAKSMWKKMPKN